MAGDRSSIPRPLRPFVGGGALVVTVRAVDAVWRRVTGRPTPVATREEDDGRATEPAIVRDRLAYALLLGGALRLARRLGLPAKDTATKDGASKDGASKDA